MTPPATHRIRLALLLLCIILAHHEVSAQSVAQDADVSARQMIEIGEESLRQLDDEILRLKNLDPPPDAQIAEKQANRDRLSALLDRQHRVVNDFEVARSAEDDEASKDEQDRGLPSVEPAPPVGGPREIDRKFDASKREFDEKMMREMARIGVMEAEDMEAVGEQDGNLAEAMEAARRRLEEQGREGEADGPGPQGETVPSKQGPREDAEGAGDGQDLGDFEGMESPPDGDASEEEEGQESEEGDWGAGAKRGTEGEDGEGGKGGEGEPREGEEDASHEGVSKEGDDGQEVGSTGSISYEKGDPKADGQREGMATEGRDSRTGRQSGGEGAPVGAGDDDPQGLDDPSQDPEIGDGLDDDIVARQLREAAEKETDAELKKKLWEEYKNYKRSN